MNTSTTVATARLLFGSLFNTTDFLNYINQAQERVTNSGLWKGSIGYAAFPVVNDYFTLPYAYLSIIGAQWFVMPVPVFGQMHDFIEGGPGQAPMGRPPRGIVEDLGDGYATLCDPPTPGSTLKFVPDILIDSGRVFRIYGISNGVEIFDVNGAGMNITVNYPSTSEATVFDRVTGIQFPLNSDGSPVMIGGLTLYAVDPLGNQTKLSYYYPNETTPSYRRYQIGVTSASNTQVPNAVTVLVRRRFVPVFKETDWIAIGNLGALKFAMQAIDCESTRSDADALWAKCYATLNQELHAVRGAVRPQVDTGLFSDCAGFDNIH